jgi:hypothetical protein
MTFITKTHLTRRTFLQGMGTSVALPLLDAMIPARTLLASAARSVPRLAFVYFPHGAVMSEWAPAAAGARAPLGRILEPLAPFRDRLTVLGGLENRHAFGPVHAITPGTWLSGVSPRGAQDPSQGVTADQVAAAKIARDTPLPSIQLAAEEPKRIGASFWEGEYADSYGMTVSLRGSAEPLPMEHRPRQVFDRLFTRRASPSPKAMPASGGASVLDLVAADTASLRRRLGPSDRARLGAYLDTVRDIERRAGKAEADLQPGDRSQAEIAGAFAERQRLMFDMIALAFQADITRVASFMMAAEASDMTYDHAAVPESFHLVSHHLNTPEKLEKLLRIQSYHTRVFAQFVEQLSALPDGDGSLLDHSLILYGSNMSNSNAHDHFPLPAAVVGGGCGKLRGGQHLCYPDRTPLANLLVTMLDRAGIGVASIGDSTGQCGGI